MPKQQDHTSIFLSGEVVDLFKDWQYETTPLGRARLVKRVNCSAYEYIIDDNQENYSENSQIIFSFERWVVEFLDDKRQITWNKRYVKRVGLPVSTNYKENTSRLPIDRFLTVNGKEVF